jgi:hypothetical protein
MEVTYHCININLNLCKSILGVGSKASNLAVVGELGRYSLYIDIVISMIKYWISWRTELSYAQNKNRGKKIHLLGMDTCPSLNDIMEIRCNKCTRSEQGYDF